MPPIYIVSFRTNLLRGFCAINTFEVGQVYLYLLAGQEHPWDRCRFRLRVHRQTLHPRRSHYICQEVSPLKRLTNCRRDCSPQALEDQAVVDQAVKDLAVVDQIVEDPALVKRIVED